MRRGCYGTRIGPEGPELIPMASAPIKAKALLQEQPDLDHEYLSITGLPEFTSASAQLIFGKDSPAIKEGR